MQSAETTTLMQECLRLHLQGAAASFKKAFIVALIIALLGALAVGILCTNVGIFIACLLLFSLMTAPIPFAVRYVSVSRIKDLQRKIEASPGIIASVALLKAQPASVAGGAAIGAIYGSSERVVVSTTSGEQFALFLPVESALRLAEAFRTG